MPRGGVVPLAAAALALLAAAPAQAFTPRVPADFYGVGFQAISKLGPAAQNRQLGRIASLGIHYARINASWASMEGTAPKNGVHSYQWGAMDQQIKDMARHGIHAEPTLTQPPLWAAVKGVLVNLQCDQASSRAPVNTQAYVQFVRAYAKRYGRGGSFWAAHPKLRYTPVDQYEIWNEPNLKGGWCPHPEPAVYADMFISASKAIRRVDPNATIYSGGVAIPSPQKARDQKSYLGIADFYGRATTSQPRLGRYMDGAGVHIYPGKDTAGQLQKLALFRSQLHDGHVPDSVPMIINEVGWPTHVGKVPMTEAQRAAAYSKMAMNYAHTNCNVGAILPHTWISPERNAKKAQDWFGIADPRTGAPYPSAKHYAFAAALMEGKLSVPPPKGTLTACPGM